MLRGRWLAWAAAWFAVSAIEALLVGKIDPQETPVGIGIAALAVVATAAALAVAGVRYAVPLAPLVQLPALAADVVRDTFVVTAALVRVLRGEAPEDTLEERPFDPGSGDPASAARGALAIAGASAAPNTIVVDVDPQARTMLVHRLAR